LASPDNPQLERQGPVEGELHSTFEDNSSTFGLNRDGPAATQVTVPASSEKPVWNGWDVLLIAVLTFVVVELLQFAFAKAAQLLWYPRLNLGEAAQRVQDRPILLIILQFMVYVPVAALMIAWVEGKYHVSFWQSIHWNWPRSAWKLLALGGILLLVLNALENVLPMPKATPFEKLFDRPLDSYLLAFIAIALAPLMEELFFRGLLYPVLARRLGAAWAVILSALPFALLHLPQYGYAWAIVLMIFIVGVVCGVVRATTRSVAASVLVHVGYNGTQMLIAIFLTHGFTRMPKGVLEYFSGC
jgi:membrane protease YdiL (CAAX protease family)